jgi:hypothetical protein
VRFSRHCKPNCAQFVLSLDTPPRIRLGVIPPTSPRSHAHTLLVFLILSLSLSSSFSPPTHTINPHHSTICFLHSLALTVGSLISIQSSRQITLVTPSAPTPLQLPASNQPYSSGFVQVRLPDPVLSCKSLPKRPSTCTALHIYLNVDHDTDFDMLRLLISPTHTAHDLPHSNSQHQR